MPDHQNDRQVEQDARLHALLRAAQREGVTRPNEKMTVATQKLLAALWEIALPALIHMINSRRITTAGPIRQSIPLTHEEWEYLTSSHGTDDRRDLACEMILAGISRFLDVVVTSARWDEQQSRLSTYFINGCLVHKSKVLTDWATRRREMEFSRSSRGSEFHFAALAQPHLRSSPELQEAVADLVATAPPDVLPLLQHLADGYSISEIAEELHLAPGTLRTRLYRWRKNVVTPKIADSPAETLPQGYALTQHLTDLARTNPRPTRSTT